MSRDAYYDRGAGGEPGSAAEGYERGPAFDTDAAYDFLYRFGTPLEHARLSHWRRDSNEGALWRTLERYQNADGGWCHGIDPDYPGPLSSVQSTIEALRILVAHKQADHPGVQRTVQWLKSVMLSDGTWHELDEVANGGAPQWYRPGRLRIWETCCIAGYCLELGYTDMWSAAARYVRQSWPQMPAAEVPHPYWATLLLLGRSQSEKDLAITGECFDQLRRFVRRERLDAYDCSWVVEVLSSIDTHNVDDLLAQVGDLLAARQGADGGVDTGYGEQLRIKATFNALMAVALLQQRGL